MMSKGSLFIRPILVAILLALTFGYTPYNHFASAQAGTILSEDFNHCSLDPGIWTFENPANAANATPTISGQYTGEALLNMSVPGGQSYTFSDTNKNAPHIMQHISDNDFNVEVRFQAPMNSDTADWKIQGILVKDATNPSAPKWLRFDFNTRNSALNSYLGYINAAGTLVHIQNVSDLPGSNPTSGPLFIRVNYQKSTGNWSVTHQVGASGTLTRTVEFTEATYDPNFVVTDIGLFVGSTGGNPPAHTAQVDYFRNMATANFQDDLFLLTVNKAGSGQGSVNWPMTSSAQCSGSTVTLTASPTSGSSFGGWSGDVISSSPTVQVQMNSSKTVVATFNGGLPVDRPYDFYLPYISNR